MSFSASFFLRTSAFFCTILNNVECECTSPWFDQGQPNDATDVKSRDLFDLGEDVKFGVVFEAGFTEELVILFLPFRSLLHRQVKRCNTGQIDRAETS